MCLTSIFFFQYIYRNECEQLRAEVLSQGAAELASAAQVRELRRKIALLSATSVKQSPIQTNDVDTDDIGMQKVTIQVNRQIDEVKKKVSFN